MGLVIVKMKAAKIKARKNTKAKTPDFMEDQEFLRDEKNAFPENAAAQWNRVHHLVVRTNPLAQSEQDASCQQPIGQQGSRRLFRQAGTAGRFFLPAVFLVAA